MRSAEDIIVEGNLTGSMKSQCGRCLCSFEMPLDMEVRITFAPQVENDQSADSGEVIVVDEGVSSYTGNTIDFSKEVKDQILVNLPISPVCRKDCRGLCPQCGADLNENPCKCGGGKDPSPFDKLAELKARLG